MSSCLQPGGRHSELGAQATGTLTVDDRSRDVAFTLTQPRQTEKAAEGQRSDPELLGAFQRRDIARVDVVPVQRLLTGADGGQQMQRPGFVSALAARSALG